MPNSHAATAEVSAAVHEVSDGAAHAPSQGSAALVARLQDPEVAGALGTLLDHADLLAVLVEGLDQFVSRSEVIGDSLLAGIQELRGAAQGDPDHPRPDLGAIAGAGASLAGVLPKAAPSLVSAVESGALVKLMDTAMVSAEAMDQMQLLARGLVSGSERFQHRPVEVSGPVSLVRALRDPDVNRAISFFITVAKSIGQELGKPLPPSAS